MNSKLSRLTAAVIAVIIVLSGILYLGDSNQGVALGSIIESMQKMNWIHAKATVQQGGQTLINEEWECFNQKIKISVEPDGVISYRDYDNSISYIYQPDSNTIIINSMTNLFDQTFPESPAEIVQLMIEQFESEGGQVTSKKATMNNKPVEIFNMVSENQDLTLVVDVQKNLAISIDTIAHIPNMSAMDVTVSISLEYPEKGPADIYALGVPRDTKVVDNRPKGNVQGLFNKIQKYYDEGFEDHIAIVFESYVEDDNILEPKKIIVMRQNGLLKRLDRYNVYNYTGSKSNIPTLYSSVKDTWPQLTIQDVLGLEDDIYAEYHLVYDGKTSYLRSNFGGQESTNSLHTDMFQMGDVETLARLSRCNPKAIIMNYSNEQVHFETLEEDAEHPGLVGFSIIEQRNTSRLPSDGIKEIIITYWMDPAKDYLITEHIVENIRDNGTYISTRKTVQTAKTESGKWYPKILITESFSPDANGQIHRSIEERLILVDTNHQFKKGIFENQ